MKVVREKSVVVTCQLFPDLYRGVSQHKVSDMIGRPVGMSTATPLTSIASCGVVRPVQYAEDVPSRDSGLQNSNSLTDHHAASDRLNIGDVNHPVDWVTQYGSNSRHECTAHQSGRHENAHDDDWCQALSVESGECDRNRVYDLFDDGTEPVGNGVDVSMTERSKRITKRQPGHSPLSSSCGAPMTSVTRCSCSPGAGWAIAAQHPPLHQHRYVAGTSTTEATVDNPSLSGKLATVETESTCLPYSERSRLRSCELLTGWQGSNDGDCDRSEDWLSQLRGMGGVSGRKNEFRRPHRFCRQSVKATLADHSSGYPTRGRYDLGLCASASSTCGFSSIDVSESDDRSRRQLHFTDSLSAGAIFLGENRLYDHRAHETHLLPVVGGVGRNQFNSGMSVQPHASNLHGLGGDTDGMFSSKPETVSSRLCQLKRKIDYLLTRNMTPKNPSASCEESRKVSGYDRHCCERFLRDHQTTQYQESFNTTCESPSESERYASSEASLGCVPSGTTSSAHTWNSTKQNTLRWMDRFPPLPKNFCQDLRLPLMPSLSEYSMKMLGISKSSSPYTDSPSVFTASDPVSLRSESRSTPTAHRYPSLSATGDAGLVAMVNTKKDFPNTVRSECSSRERVGASWSCHGDGDGVQRRFSHPSPFPTNPSEIIRQTLMSSDGVPRRSMEPAVCGTMSAGEDCRFPTRPACSSRDAYKPEPPVVGSFSMSTFNNEEDFTRLLFPGKPVTRQSDLCWRDGKDITLLIDTEPSINDKTFTLPSPTLSRTYVVDSVRQRGSLGNSDYYQSQNGRFDADPSYLLQNIVEPNFKQRPPSGSKTIFRHANCDGCSKERKDGGIGEFGGFVIDLCSPSCSPSQASHCDDKLPIRLDANTSDNLNYDSDLIIYRELEAYNLKRKALSILAMEQCSKADGRRKDDDVQAKASIAQKHLQLTKEGHRRFHAGQRYADTYSDMGKMLSHCETVRGGDQCAGVAMRKQGHQSRSSLKMAETPISRASADTLLNAGKTGELFSHGSIRPSPASAVCVKGSETPSKLISGLNLSDRGTPDVTTLSVSSHPSPGYTPTHRTPRRMVCISSPNRLHRTKQTSFSYSDPFYLDHWKDRGQKTHSKKTLSTEEVDPVWASNKRRRINAISSPKRQLAPRLLDVNCSFSTIAGDTDKL